MTERLEPQKVLDFVMRLTETPRRRKTPKLLHGTRTLFHVPVILLQQIIDVRLSMRKPYWVQIISHRSTESPAQSHRTGHSFCSTENDSHIGGLDIHPRKEKHSRYLA